MPLNLKNYLNKRENVKFKAYLEEKQTKFGCLSSHNHSQCSQTHWSQIVIMDSKKWVNPIFIVSWPEFWLVYLSKPYIQIWHGQHSWIPCNEPFTMTYFIPSFIEFHLRPTFSMHPYKCAHFCIPLYISIFQVSCHLYLEHHFESPM